MLTSLFIDILLSTLTAAAPAGDTAEATEAPAADTAEAPAAEPPVSYEQSWADLKSATAAMADRDPEESIAALEAALAEVGEHPRELLHDAQASEAIRKARVALAWLQLARGDMQAAADAMDEALRGSGGSPLPLIGLGPELSALHDERLAALKEVGVATISITCEACDVLIDEVKVPLSGEYFLGVHRVWIFDSLGEIPPYYEEFDLDTPDQVLPLEYKQIEQVVETTELPPPPPPPPPSPAAKIGGAVTTGLGGRLLVGGAVLFAMNGSEKATCPAGAVSCERNTIVGGSMLSALGVAFVVTGVSLLVYDAKQKKGSKQSARRIAPHGAGFAF
ncbi:MAG: hypothetical protein KC457_19010 [Myxococcales bacterium]|nr:hypothetical protein [Myxococcales bacterium]